MTAFLSPRSLQEALEMKAAAPGAIPVAGGTDVMVEVNAGRLRPQTLLDVSRLPELGVLRPEGGSIFVGAGVTYARMVCEPSMPGPLRQAARSVGSPQIRRRGTIGGNLGTASPAGDTLPVLAAYDAYIEVASATRGTRRVPWDQFLVGPKKNSLAEDELITGAGWKVVRGAGSFSKVGPRNAMVITVTGLCLVLDEDRREVRVALGSVGPTVIRAREAEAFIDEALAAADAWDDRLARLSPADLESFGERVAAAARPIDDVRGSADYRRHALRVLARRALGWAMEDR